jgi:hypothetical protein
VPGATAAPPRVGHGCRQPAAPHLRRQVSPLAPARSGELGTRRPRGSEDWPALGLRSSVAKRGTGPWARGRGRWELQHPGTEVIEAHRAMWSEGLQHLAEPSGFKLRRSGRHHFNKTVMPRASFSGTLPLSHASKNCLTCVQGLTP